MDRRVRARTDRAPVSSFAARFDTGLGPMTTIVDEAGVVLRLLFDIDAQAWMFAEEGLLLRPRRAAHVVREVRSYLAGKSRSLRLRVALRGTPFQVTVWKALRRIRRGQTMSFGELAATIGRPTAVRACTRAVVQAPAELLIPTHRIVGGDGRLHGPRHIVQRKQKLLELEDAWDSATDRVDDRARRRRSE